MNTFFETPKAHSEQINADFHVLCRDYERAGFAEGIKIDIRLSAE